LLMHAIHIAAHGYAVLDATLLRKALQMRPTQAIARVVSIVDSKVEVLTELERDLLQLVAEGQSTREIAARFGATDVLVKRSLQTVVAKLNARNRTHAAVTAIRLGLI